MKRCERNWTPARAAATQELERKLCGGHLPCEMGIPCPLFRPGAAEAKRVAAAPEPFESVA